MEGEIQEYMYDCVSQFSLKIWSRGLFHQNTFYDISLLSNTRADWAFARAFWKKIMRTRKLLY
jgi:hypothetical protein